jgi:hypothetical protein
MISIEWLKKELENYGSNSHLSLDWNTFDELVEQAKEMHKQEIIDAFWSGDNSDCTNEQNSKEFAEQYYQEIFKK